MKVYEALEHIKKNGPPLDLYGICACFPEVPGIAYQTKVGWNCLHKKAFTSWKHYSGDIDYPVEGDWWKYWKHRNRRWDPKSKYGRLRRQLLNHLIAWFKEKDI